MSSLRSVRTRALFDRTFAVSQISYGWLRSCRLCAFWSNSGALSPPDTKKPAHGGLFRIWRRERDDCAASPLALRARHPPAVSGLMSSLRSVRTRALFNRTFAVSQISYGWLRSCRLCAFWSNSGALSPPDTKKPAQGGLFRIWRRERDDCAASPLALRARHPPAVSGLMSSLRSVRTRALFNRTFAVSQISYGWLRSCRLCAFWSNSGALSPPDTKKPAQGGLFRIWRRERDDCAASPLALRARHPLAVSGLMSSLRSVRTRALFDRTFAVSQISYGWLRSCRLCAFWSNSGALSPPDTKKPAQGGLFRIWRRERDSNPRWGF